MLETVFRSLRPPFLLLTPVCLFLGASTAFRTGVTIDWVTLTLVFIAAISAHISVNTLNEYQDFQSGLDAHTQPTPFSGGSGALPANPNAASTVLTVAIASLVLTIATGLYLISSLGQPLIWMGIAGVLLIVTYTQWLNRQPWLCLIAPGIAFGPIMVLGTHSVLSGTFSLQALIASLVPFFLVNNLLLLNQFPDIEADRMAQRNHLPIAYGTTFSSYIYGLFSLASLTIVLLGVQLQTIPTLSYLAIIPLVATAFVVYSALKFADDIPRLLPSMGLNVVATLTTPLLLGLGILLG